MDNQNNIQDELRDMNSGLPAHNSQMPFSVPEGYFDGLAASILAKIKGQQSSAADELRELSPFLAGISKEMPYTLPAGYFEENLSALPSFIKEETSVVLATIGKNLPYTVPQGYFENLPVQVMAKLVRPKAKVVPLFARKWMRAAVAAVVGGAMLLGGYRLLYNADNDEPGESAFQPADTTQKLVAKNGNSSVVQDIKTASTEELDAFIKSVPLNMTKLEKEAPYTTGKKEVKDLLKDVSETEIDAFLEQLPTADDDLAVID